MNNEIHKVIIKKLEDIKIAEISIVNGSIVGIDDSS